ncbi:ATP-binding cassette domain-containing protein [Mucilaginibacter phyllosphaerae]|uniref:ATP-binding cassette domain-containing protein n=1 Tax=Mucilaginibacter phyllosphaerae TaxID=1812349 RepID=A0A4Y8A8C2_9SPHI|nr:ATP-binding cassette domain-containing protein [Mucilaginibacter phyllosphaerae]MBB3970954.1 molybdate transport system ATP-binding protein [Mucilaginibacter phyllosphaerae]TEW64114.1 ATP-binding cassette domain-containing protein [Mucilaginibacter phyllosphaerae]GGH05675.1 molybdenum ABC transporter ATP-binding protein [Mucilaginibacter phyllosphaerae]
MKIPVIKLDNIAVKFINQQIFKQLNFTLNSGDNWAITGKSGSGKSVLLQTIAGNISISGGNITYHFMADVQQPAGNTPVNFHRFIAFAGARHHFKTLSNTSNFYYQQRYNSSDSEDTLTVSQYLQSVKANEHKPLYWTYDRTVAALNLTGLCDKQTIKLSNGETKRLMIAAALLKNPLILLLDNPMTGLDIATRQTFNILLNEISASGISIIMATSAFEIPDCITHVAVLNDGNITQRLTKQEFNTIEQQHADKPVIDKEALSGLLNSFTTAHNYKQIVSMGDVHIQYGDKTILNNINWQINPGERWALLGPNGAGKSTLLSLINGDNPQAYANNIILFDKKRGTGESIWDIKSKIGFVSPEFYQYFPTDNSCLQVIESGFYDTLGLFRPSIKSRADQALNWMKALEIDQYARHLLKNIPASAQRLCLLARALIKNPALLIFDEPCQGLDDHQQQHFKSIVDAICSISDATLIYVTHYQHEIPDSVDKVLRLDKGEVV